MPSDPLQQWQLAERLAASGALATAADAYRPLLERRDWALPAHLRLSMLAARAGKVREATRHALAAAECAAEEADPALVEGLCRQLLGLGEIEAGLAAGSLDLAVLLSSNVRNPRLHVRQLLDSRRQLWLSPTSPPV